MSSVKSINEARGGTLCTVGNFVIPILKGSYREMGAQYGVLKKDHMQKAYDTVVQPQVDLTAVITRVSVPSFLIGKSCTTTALSGIEP